MPYLPVDIGTHAVDWLLKQRVRGINTREKAVEFFQELMYQNKLFHVVNEHSFQDGYYFYALYVTSYQAILSFPPANSSCKSSNICPHSLLLILVWGVSEDSIVCACARMHIRVCVCVCVCVGGVGITVWESGMCRCMCCNQLLFVTSSCRDSVCVLFILMVICLWFQSVMNLIVGWNAGKHQNIQLGGTASILWLKYYYDVRRAANSCL